MDENKDYVHFMVRHANGKMLGWIAPVEQPDAGPTGGSYVVPLTRNGRFSKQYQVDFARYSGDGQRGTTETTIVAVERFEGKYLFVLQVAGQSITLQENPGDTALNRLKYVGQLSHPDFASTLVEIEAVPEDALDDLFTRTGYVLIGCDPWTKYVGIDNLPQGEPPNKPSDPNGEPSIVKACRTMLPPFMKSPPGRDQSIQSNSPIASATSSCGTCSRHFHSPTRNSPTKPANFWNVPRRSTFRWSRDLLFRFPSHSPKGSRSRNSPAPDCSIRSCRG